MNTKNKQFRDVGRVAMLLLLLLFNSSTALALTEGPWTYDSRRYGSCSLDYNNTMTFWGLGNSSSWGTPSQW